MEKPVTVSFEQTELIAQLTLEAGVSVSVNHNFVFSRPFNRLKKVLDSGGLGPIKSVRVVWKKVLAPTNYGPWDLWMLREPGNILFETGSHSLSELLAVVERPKINTVAARLPKVLPSGSIFYRRWNISGEAGPVFIQIDMAFDQGYEQHFVEVEGMFGVAVADIENDVFIVDLPTGGAYDLERLRVNLRAGIERIKQGMVTYASYAASKFLKTATGGPQMTSMLIGIDNCYKEIRGRATRRESSIEYAVEIARIAESIQAKMPPLRNLKKTEMPVMPKTVSEPEVDAKILIVGASGFIGKRLLLALQCQGRSVRALVRNVSSLAGVQLAQNSEVMVGDYRNNVVIEKALFGIEVVFHLAVVHSNCLNGYLKSDSEPTIEFARRCQQHNIRRFIYTGTIDSLDLARPAVLKESDGVDKRLSRRNNYAHSKAITEAKLMELFQQGKFPVVIVRPAIVLGSGGPVNHVGVANWFGLGLCTLWGQGENLIPIVLVDDVVSGLISAADVEHIEGNTYNLSANPCLSARDYVREIEKELGSRIEVRTSSAYKHYLGDLFKWGIKVLARHPDRSRFPSVQDWRCREQHASFDTSRAQQELN